MRYEVGVQGHSLLLCPCFFQHKGHEGKKDTKEFETKRCGHEVLFDFICALCALCGENYLRVKREAPRNDGSGNQIVCCHASRWERRRPAGFGGALNKFATKTAAMFCIE
jgi:hypothetical protein